MVLNIYLDIFKGPLIGDYFIQLKEFNSQLIGYADARYIYMSDPHNGRS